MASETFVGAVNLVTPHPASAYQGVLAVKPGPLWEVAVLVPNDGQTFVALGGERAYGYQTVDGGQAQEFELRKGDRATRLRSDLPHSMGEWRIDRAE